MTGYEMLVQLAAQLGVTGPVAEALVFMGDAAARALTDWHNGVQANETHVEVRQDVLQNAAQCYNLRVDWPGLYPVFVTAEGRRVEMPALEDAEPNAVIEEGSRLLWLTVPIDEADVYYYVGDGVWRSQHAFDAAAAMAADEDHDWHPLDQDKILASWCQWLPGVEESNSYGECFLQFDLNELEPKGWTLEKVKAFLSLAATHLNAHMDVRSPPPAVASRGDGYGGSTSYTKYFDFELPEFLRERFPIGQKFHEYAIKR